ncbi:hypothetical protein X975_20461, partial [Stegodyphus mimosarum]
MPIHYQLLKPKEMLNSERHCQEINDLSKAVFNRKQDKCCFGNLLENRRAGKFYRLHHTFQ